MTPLKFHLDENVHPAVADGLRQRGLDATTTSGRRLMRASDDEQLRFATRENRAVVSHDVATLPSLHAAWLAAGRQHAGIILAPIRPVGELVRALVAMARDVEAVQLRGELVWLSAWLPSGRRR